METEEVVGPAKIETEVEGAAVTETEEVVRAAYTPASAVGVEPLTAASAVL